MKYYTSTIPPALAEKLKEKGMLRECILQDGSPVIYDLPQDDLLWAECKAYFIPSYAEVFDWLLSEKNINIEIYFSMIMCNPNEKIEKTYSWRINSTKLINEIIDDRNMTWYSAATAAIEKALTLI